MFSHGDAAGGEFDPNVEETAKREVVLAVEPPAAGAFAAVGWRSAGLEAAAVAARHPDRVDRLVLCCVPAPTEGADFAPAEIAAKTLLLYGQLDDDAPLAHARWWKDRLRDARVEMVPRRGSDIIGSMWARVLSHAAPHTVRRTS